MDGKDPNGASSKCDASSKGAFCARGRQASTSRFAACRPPHPVAAGRRTASKSGRHGTHRDTNAVTNETSWPQGNLCPRLRLSRRDRRGNGHKPCHQAASTCGTTTAYAKGATTATSFTAGAGREPSARGKPSVSQGPPPPPRLPRDRRRNGQGSFISTTQEASQARHHLAALVLKRERKPLPRRRAGRQRFLKAMRQGHRHLPRHALH